MPRSDLDFYEDYLMFVCGNEIYLLIFFFNFLIYILLLQGWTPLCHAVMQGHAEVALTLMCYGARLFRDEMGSDTIGRLVVARKKQKILEGFFGNEEGFNDVLKTQLLQSSQRFSDFPTVTKEYMENRYHDLDLARMRIDIENHLPPINSDAVSSPTMRVLSSPSIELGRLDERSPSNFRDRSEAMSFSLDQTDTLSPGRDSAETISTRDRADTNYSSIGSARNGARMSSEDDDKVETPKKRRPQTPKFPPPEPPKAWVPTRRALTIASMKPSVSEQSYLFLVKTSSTTRCPLPFFKNVYLFPLLEQAHNDALESDDEPEPNSPPLDVPTTPVKMNQRSHVILTEGRVNAWGRSMDDSVVRYSYFRATHRFSVVSLSFIFIFKIRRDIFLINFFLFLLFL
jgi:hypothetical protein